jgi:hypothetical protein
MTSRQIRAAALLAVTVAACGSTATSTTHNQVNPDDASAPRDAVAHDSGHDAGVCMKPGNKCDAGAACATTPNDACEVTTTSGSGSLPAFKGGPIADGTYVLTSAVSYGASTGAAGQTQRITLTFSGGNFTLVQDEGADCNGVPTGSGTYSTSSDTLILDLTCPLKANQSASYTATATTLSYSFNGTDGSGVVETFTKE